MRVGLARIGDELSGEGDVFAAQFGVSEVVVHYRDVIPVSLIIALPLSLLMLASYFKTLLHELERPWSLRREPGGILFHIPPPHSLPGIAVLIYAFGTTWNEFIFVVCLATDPSGTTLAIGLAGFSTESNTDPGAVMAAAPVVMTIPIAIHFLVFQRHSSAGSPPVPSTGKGAS